ncbi:phosphatidylinositol N-acetylglucosaminyltransferase subunit gpi1 [Entophlyctis luteolus]|nr:phosphatidylinositol N-acetylglucosaminyltransferase subunit gpi1 [Entophlyctis luteolus]
MCASQPKRDLVQLKKRIAGFDGYCEAYQSFSTFIVYISDASPDVAVGSFSPQARTDNHDVIVEFYEFRQPRSAALQYMCLDPLILDLSQAKTATNAGTPGRERISGYRESEAKLRVNMERHLGSCRHGRLSEFPIVLQKINECYTHESRLLNSALTRVLTTVESAAKRSSDALAVLRRPVVVPVMTAVFALRAVAEVALWCLNKRIRIASSEASLKDVSQFANQINLRLQQACFWPQQYFEWRYSSQKLSPLCQAQYIGSENCSQSAGSANVFHRFYNTVWLIANDVILGGALGSLSIAFAEELSSLFVSLLDTTMQSFIAGHLFLWLLELWSNNVAIWMRTQLPVIVRTIGVIGGMAGASAMVSLVADVVGIATLHLHLFYIVAGKIYRWQVDAMLSLLTTFRGKKLNVLRERVDYADFDLDQLLVGTILFTLLVFLFPTVSVYYLLFTLTRLAVVLVQGGFEIILAFLNHFPLFAILLRIKDPNRLPGGVRIEVRPKTVNDEDSSKYSSAYLAIENIPIGANVIFHQYLYILDRLATSYLNASVTKSFFTGRSIERVPRLQYPTIPERDFTKLPDFTKMFESFVKLTQHDPAGANG